jgi:ferrous iron transport protein B
MDIALAGNPNSGKTSLFNYLTGSKQHVGNWPGVTVEKKDGTITAHGRQYTLVDLPGIYTLEPDTIEQKLTRDFILREKPGLIINILDATNLERNLYFTLQLRETGVPMIIALNMMDEVRRSGVKIDMTAMSKILGVPVVGISAATGEGVKELTDMVYDFDCGKIKVNPFCLGCTECSKCKHGEFCYGFIDSIMRQCVDNRKKPGKTDPLTEKIDKVVLNKYLAFPIFLVIMFIVFSLTFGTLMSKLADAISYVLTVMLAGSLRTGLADVGANSLIVSLVCDGVIPGIGTVLTFLPQIALLFILMSILEDSGYMARAAILMDRIFAAFGLSGSSFIPMIMGFGCAVPAVMSCRILPSEKDRRLTIVLTSFISCSARLPLYALMTGVFFVRMRSVVIFSIYLLGIGVAILTALILNKTVLKNKGTSFVMELPPYRVPNPRNLIMHTWEKVKGFMIKAGTVIFGASVVIWFLQSFTPALAATTDPSGSIIAYLGRFISPIFAPLGFGTWQAATALLSGVAAKELVVSTFSVLSSGSGTVQLHSVIASLFTPASAYAFMAFVLLYCPCVSAMATMRRELNSHKWMAGTLALDFSAAWVAAFVIYNIGRLMGF